MRALLIICLFPFVEFCMGKGRTFCGDGQRLAFTFAPLAASRACGCREKGGGEGLLAAPHSVEKRRAVRWAMQRAAMAGAACCVCRASAQAGSALCGESKEGMPWSRAACVPSLSGKPGFPACRVLSHCAVCHGLQSALRRLLGQKAPFRVPHRLIVRPICCAKAEIVIPL